MDYAFTDQMVRDDREELTRAAISYLERYKGSFRPILDARTAYLTGEELNIAEIRTILNVMRADTSIRMTYDPPLRSNVIEFPRNKFAPVDSDEPRRPMWYRIRMEVKPEYVYGMSMHKRAQVIHDISRVKSYAEYFPVGSYERGRQIWEPRIKFHIKWGCTGPNTNNFRLLTVREADSLILQGCARPCPSCERLGDA